MPVVAVFGNTTGHYPAEFPLPQDPPSVSDAAYTGVEGVDVVYMGVNYYLGTGIPVVGGAHVPDGDRRRSESADGRPFGMDSPSGQSQNQGAAVTVGAGPQCLCFDTYPYRCEAHDPNDFFYIF